MFFNCAERIFKVGLGVVCESLLSVYLDPTMKIRAEIICFSYAWMKLLVAVISDPCNQVESKPTAKLKQ
jgi:hypothetical protein